MDAAFQCFNNNNIVQIDSTFQNYGCIQKGTIPLTWGNAEMYPDPNYPETIVNCPGSVNPLIAITSPHHVRSWRERTANGFRFRFTVDDYNTVARPFNIDYYVFDSFKPTLNAHGVGMQLFNASNQLVFDSSFEYMRVIGVIRDPATFPYIDTIFRNYRFSNGKVAVVTCQQAMKTLNTDIWVGGSNGTVPGIEFYSLTPRVEGSTIYTMDRMVFSIIGSAVAFINRPQSFMLAIDVSDMLPGS